MKELEEISERSLYIMKGLKNILRDAVEKHGIDLTAEVVEKIITLVTASFGLILALAWNSAIQSIFEVFFPKPSATLIAQLVYALFITVVVVMIMIYLSRLLELIKKLREEPKEDEKRKGE